MKYFIFILLSVFLSSCFKTEVQTKDDVNIEDINISTQEEETTVRDQDFYATIKDLRKSGDLEQAKEISLEQLDNYPESEDLLTQIGLIYIEQEDYENAQEYFSRILKKNSKNISAYLNLALIYHKTSDPEKYEKNIDKVKSIDPNNSQLISFLEDLEPIDEREVVVDTYAVLEQELMPIREMIINEEYTAALDKLYAVQKTYGDEEEILLMMADIHLGLKDYSKSVKIYESIYANNQSFDIVYGLLINYYNLGLSQAAQEKYSESIAIADETEQEALDKFTENMDVVDGILPIMPIFNPNYAEDGSSYQEIEAKLARINTLYSEGSDYASIEMELQKLNENYPSHPKILYWLGRLNLEQNSDFKSALSYYKESNFLIPNNIYTLEGLFWSNFRLGNMSESIGFFKQAESLGEKFESYDFAEEIVSKNE